MGHEVLTGYLSPEPKLYLFYHGRNQLQQFLPPPKSLRAQRYYIPAGFMLIGYMSDLCLPSAPFYLGCM